MASVFLTTAVPSEAEGWDWNSPARVGLQNLKRLENAAQRSPTREHALAADAEHADIILFVGSTDAYHEDIRRSRLYRAFPQKCFVFDSADKVVPFLPGIYASIEKRWHSTQWTRSGFYLNVMDNQAIAFQPPHADPPFLFSFVGSIRTASVRSSIVRLSHASCLLVDVDSPQDGLFSHQNHDRVRHYVDVMVKSRFVLCPRGVGTSSWRLFEAMKMGRAPVIISDQWVPPSGPDWPAFSIRVPEKDVARLPRVLEDRKQEAEKMGLVARSQWEQWFSETACFHRIAGWCSEINASRRLPAALFRVAARRRCSAHAISAAGHPRQ